MMVLVDVGTPAGYYSSRLGCPLQFEYGRRHGLFAEVSMPPLETVTNTHRAILRLFPHLLFVRRHFYVQVMWLMGSFRVEAETQTANGVPRRPFTCKTESPEL